MDSTTVNQPGTVALTQPSTVLNPQTTPDTSGAGKPDLRQPDDKKSVESVLEGELARLKDEDKPDKTDADKDAKADDKGKKVEAKDAKPKDEDKPGKARSDDGKFAKADKADEPDTAKAAKSAPDEAAAERGGTEDGRQSEGRKYAEPPARFLPEARGKWANVPYEVKAEFHRVSQEMDTEISRYKEGHEAYENVREFADLAKQGGTDLRTALTKYVNLENFIRRDPVAGLNEIMRNAGIDPQKYAEFIQKNPQATQMQPRQAAAQPANDPRVNQLADEVTALKTQLATASVTPVIERFAASHPDYYDLQDQIASVLETKVVEKIYGNGLSPEQKLAEAYRIAGGSTPSRSAPEPNSGHSVAPTAPSRDAGQKPSVDAGTKSIRGAPDDGQDTAVEEGSSDIETLLRKEMKRMRA